ncbi:MAG: DNA-processing protein DprA [Parascardovia denticolens]
MTDTLLRVDRHTLALATLTYCCNTASAIMHHLIYPQEGYFQEMLDQGGPYPEAADQGRPHPLGASSDSVKSELVIPRMGGGQKTARETADQQPESEGLGKRTYESQSQESQPHVLQPYRTSPGRYGLEPERIVHELERLHDLGRMESPLLLKALEKTIVTGHLRKPSSAVAAFNQALERWVERMGPIRDMDDRQRETYFTQNGKLWIISPQSPLWPRHLDDLATMADSTPPLCLWGRGDSSALMACVQPVGVVGSRDCTDYGKNIAFHAGRQAALLGHTVISGGASGVDATAHWGALSAFPDLGENAGKTIAIFAGGLNNCGPLSNSRLFDQIRLRGGALISELPPDTVPEGYRFLMRNRLIAALSKIIIVAQARHRSGALNTATWAADLNRLVYAAPGDINKPYNTGCNALIAQQKAVLLQSDNDFSSICGKEHDHEKC